jgi:type I restriction enzyme S subunit
VPNGWNIQPLLDYAQFEKGFEPGAHDYYEDQGPDTVPFIRVGDMSTGRSSVYIANSYSQPMLTESDMAMSFDGTVGIVKVGFTGYFSSGIRKVLLCDVLPRPYVYQLLKSDAIQNVISQHATGSTILHAGSAINYFKFIKPPSDVLSDYSILASPILNHIGCLNKQIGIYSSSRDRLLSRLMSGKIDVEKMDIRFPESMKEEGVAHA